MNQIDREWTLRELAAETGVPERTIRFYISRGLLDPPLRGGRGAAYGAGHKARLEEIRTLQSKGLMLAEIAHVLTMAPAESRPAESKAAEPGKARVAEEPAIGYRIARMELPAPAPGAGVAPTLPESEAWRAYHIAGDVTVIFRAGAAPWRTKRLLAALRRFSAMINEDDGNNPKEGDDE
jgi:DNA-binding transcriptional MerR regulator